MKLVMTIKVTVDEPHYPVMAASDLLEDFLEKLYQIGPIAQEEGRIPKAIAFRDKEVGRVTARLVLTDSETGPVLRQND